MVEHLPAQIIAYPFAEHPDQIDEAKNGNSLDQQEGTVNGQVSDQRLRIFATNGIVNDQLGQVVEDGVDERHQGNGDQEADQFENTGIASNITLVTNDADNNLWLYTSSGIIRYDPKNGNTLLFGEKNGIRSCHGTSPNLKSSGLKAHN